MKKNNIFFKEGTFILIAIFIILASCSNRQKITFTKAPEVNKNLNEAAPLTCFVDFETTQTYDSVSFELEDTKRNATLRYSSQDKKESGYVIMLMGPGKEYQINIQIKNKKGFWIDAGHELTHKTPPLPTDEMLFPKIVLTKANDDIQDEQLTLLNPRIRLPMRLPQSNELNKAFGMLIIVNQQGEVLWYYRTNSRISDFDMLPNGNVSYMTQDSRVVEIDFAGNVIQEWYAANRPEEKDENAIPVEALTFHHDVSLLPNGNRLILSTEIREIDNYFTSELDETAPRKKQKVMGDVVLEFSPTGEIVHRWCSFDHMPVMRIGYETFSRYWDRRGFPGVIDWSHANAIVPLPDEEAYLVNFRYQSAMIKVNKSTGEIEWIFAEPTGWGEKLQGKLLDIPESGWNWHQHSPRFTSSGTLLFFNNNNYQARPFDKTKSLEESPSYVVEYKINESDKTIERIWTSKNHDEEQVVSIAMGRVSELQVSGNILACFGALLPNKHFDEMTWWDRGNFTQWTMIREYTHTAPAKIVWEMQLLPLKEDSQVGWTLFGAERIDVLNYFTLKSAQTGL